MSRIILRILPRVLGTRFEYTHAATANDTRNFSNREVLKSLSFRQNIWYEILSGFKSILFNFVIQFTDALISTFSFAKQVFFNPHDILCADTRSSLRTGAVLTWLGAVRDARPRLLMCTPVYVAGTTPSELFTWSARDELRVFRVVSKLRSTGQRQTVFTHRKI